MEDKRIDEVQKETEIIIDYIRMKVNDGVRVGVMFDAVMMSLALAVATSKNPASIAERVILTMQCTLDEVDARKEQNSQSD